MKEPSPSPNGAFTSPQKQISYSQQRDLGPTKSPALASLEWLQTQRRGSITDPSLHAAPTTHNAMKVNTVFRQPIEQPNSASTAPSPVHHDPGYKPHLPDPRPASPYVFGDATPQPAEHGAQLRKLLHTPLTEQSGPRLASSVSHDSQDLSRSNPGMPTLSFRHRQSLLNIFNDYSSFFEP